MNISKGWWIAIGIFGFFIAMLIIGSVVSRNTAIKYEEWIVESHSDIQIQEKRRHDLIGNLVQVVEANSTYEASTLEAIIAMRKSFESGNMGETMLAINAVAEQYPQLQATEGYTQLMTELSITENLISEYRKLYNGTIKVYRTFVRQFPSSMFLALSGYEKIDFEYMEYDSTETQMPEQLFGN